MVDCHPDTTRDGNEYLPLVDYQVADSLRATTQPQHYASSPSRAVPRCLRPADYRLIAHPGP